MTEQHKVSVLKPALTLTLIIMLAWVVCFWPARSLNGASGVLWMSIAAICCLIPGWIVVFLSGLAIFPTDLAALMVQSMIRLGFVGGAAVIVRKVRPELGFAEFFGWLIVFYLASLAVEVWMLRCMKIAPQEESSESASQASDS